LNERADGRGWEGRGDSGARRGTRARRRAAPRSDRDATRGAGPNRPVHGSRLYGVDDRPQRDDSGGSNVGPPPRDDAPSGEEGTLRGAGDAPWVRVETGEARAERPPTGRQAPPLPDLTTLLTLLEGVRGMVPRELSDQFNALVRELLLTLRALIDWYIERIDGPEREPEIEEIKID
jgi:hypothetical protein